MDPPLRTVTRLPLTELWNHDGPMEAQCLGRVGRAEIARLFQTTDISFVVADVGKQLQWIEQSELLTLGKSDVSPHVVDRDAAAICLGDYPGDYCYVARRWILATGRIVITLEKHH